METHVEVEQRRVPHWGLVVQQAVEMFHHIEHHHHHAEHGQHEAKRPEELADDVTVQAVHVSDPL